jgi:hypothetical protein
VGSAEERGATEDLPMTVCVCVCVCVCMCACVHACVYIMGACASVYVHLRVHIYVCISVYVQARIYMYLHACISAPLCLGGREERENMVNLLQEVP